MTDLDQNLSVKISEKNVGKGLLLSKEDHISNIVHDTAYSYLRDAILENTSLEINGIRCDIQRRVMLRIQV